jgi:dihydroxyacetone kinase
MAEQLTIRISAQSQEAEAALKRVTQNIQQLSQTARQAGANITRGLIPFVGHCLRRKGISVAEALGAKP